MTNVIAQELDKDFHDWIGDDLLTHEAFYWAKAAWVEAYHRGAKDQLQNG